MGTGLDNYAITYDNGALTVSQASLTITASSTGKVYGGTTSFAGTEFTTSGLQNSDAVTSVTLTSAGAAATAAVAGSPYDIVPSAAVGTGLDNYAITYDNGALTVSKATATISVTPYSVTYDGSAHTAVGTATGVLNESLSSELVLSGTTHTSAGSTNDTWTFSDTAGNYNDATGTASDLIGTAAVSVTADPQTKVYGDPDPAFTYANTSLIGTDAFTGSLSRDAGEGMGVYAITQGNLTAGSNYAISFTGASLTISAANVSGNNTQVAISNSSTNTTISLSSGSSNTTLNVSDVYDNTTFTATLPQITVNTSTSAGNIIVSIPAGDTVTGSSDWNGTLGLPEVISAPSAGPTNSGTNSVSEVVEVGLPSVQLNFSSAVRLLLPGMAGKRAGFSRGGAFTEITTVCNGDNQSAVDAQLLSTVGVCKMDVGSDLVIWTEHFTQFMAYTNTAPGPSASYSSNNGGGSVGGGSYVLPPAAVTPAPEPVPPAPEPAPVAQPAVVQPAQPTQPAKPTQPAQQPTQPAAPAQPSNTVAQPQAPAAAPLAAASFFGIDPASLLPVLGILVAMALVVTVAYLYVLRRRKGAA